MRDRIKLIMSGTFGVPPETIPDSAAIEEFPEWDSLRHLELMLELEMQFGLSIPLGTMLELLSFQAIEDYLHEQGVTRTE